MALLWPDSDTDRARGSLKQALHLLRTRLDEPELLLGTNDLRLNPQVIESDLGRFTRAIDDGDLPRAAELYTGGFLDGVHAAGGVEMENWISARRRTLEHRYREAIEQLATDATAAGREDDAASWLRLLQANDPTNGRVAVRLMESLEASGQRAAALQHARVHEILLREQFGLPVDAAVVEMAARLQRTTGATASGRSGNPRSADVAEGRSARIGAPGSEAPDIPRAGALASPHDGTPAGRHAPTRWRRIAFVLATGLALVLAAATFGQWRGTGARLPDDVRGTGPAARSASMQDRGPAYDAYLRGRYYLRQHTAEGTRLAQDAFRRAIAIDSTFAKAYSGLAEIEFSPSLAEPGPRFRRAREYADRALQLDDALAEAHASKAWILLWYDRDWAGSGQHLRRALELDPTYIQAVNWSSARLAALGRVEESLALMRQSHEQAPSPANAAFVGIRLLWLGQTDEAMAYYRSALSQDSTLFLALWGMGLVHLERGRLDDAIEAFRHPGLEYLGIYQDGYLGYAYAVAGRTAEARAVLARMRERMQRGEYVPPTDVGLVYLGLGDTKQALDWMERHEEDRGARVFLASNPLYAPLRAEPRFQRLLERLGLENAVVAGPTTP